MTYKGFQYLGKTYIFKEGDLFRLPFESHLRFFGIHKCKKWKDGFILGDKRKSKAQILAMLSDIESNFKFIEEKDCAF